MRTTRLFNQEMLSTVAPLGVLAIDPRALGAHTTFAGEAPSNNRRGRVAVVDVEGPLAQKGLTFGSYVFVDGYDLLAERFSAALASDADAVVLCIDSPGGDVAGLEEGVARMSRAAATAGKPVVAYVDELAASAAYWIASSLADVVVVPAAGEVGSIGCIGAFLDASGAMAKAGLAWTVIREPAGKAEQAPLAPVADLARQRLGASVKEAAGRFYAAVEVARGLTAKEVAGMNGATFRGAAAVKAGLADQVGSFEDAVAMASTMGAPKRAPAAAARTAVKVDTLTPELRAELTRHGMTEAHFRAAEAAGVFGSTAPPPSEAELAAELARHGLTLEDARKAGL